MQSVTYQRLSYTITNIKQASQMISLAFNNLNATALCLE